LEIRSVVFHRAAYKPEDFPRDGRPEFAIVGRSNVGKSSLINAILGRKGIARVSQTPGKTQAIQFYLVNDRFYIVDLPGYGYAKVSRATSAAWGDLTRIYFEQARSLRLVFLLLDSRRIPSDQDLQIHDWMSCGGVPWQVILTKTDKLSNNQLERAKRDIAASLRSSAEEWIGFSTVNRKGADAVWSQIDLQLQKVAGI